jgi:hypothetical protein
LGCKLSVVRLCDSDFGIIIIIVIIIIVVVVVVIGKPLIILRLEKKSVRN